MIMRRMTPYDRANGRGAKPSKPIVYRVRDRDRKIAPKAAHANMLKGAPDVADLLGLRERDAAR